MREHHEELALLETLDVGKPIRESLRVDVPTAAFCIEWFAEAVDKLYDEIAPTSPDALAFFASRAMQPDDPLEPGAYMGPLVDDRQLERVMGDVEVGRQDGATLLTGGAGTRVDSGGYYLEPTVFSGATNGMRIAREEIFGPVLVAVELDTLDEAIALANDSRDGLAASVWTRDLRTAHRVARALRAGTVG